MSKKKKVKINLYSKPVNGATIYQDFGQEQNRLHREKIEPKIIVIDSVGAAEEITKNFIAEKKLVAIRNYVLKQIEYCEKTAVDFKQPYMKLVAKARGRALTKVLRFIDQ